VTCFIVLPCFNEENNVKPVIHSIDRALKPTTSYKIIAVNDGSRDRTGQVLKDLSSDYPIEILEHEINQGLGAALRTGLVAAAEEVSEDDFVVTMDSDNTHDPKHVLDMLIAAQGADVVVGSRYVKGGRQLNVPAHRVILSWVINVLVKTVLQLPSRDNTSGLRCFRACLLKKLYCTFRTGMIESRGFVASLELLLKAVRSGGSVVEVPIVLDYGKKGGASKMHLLSTVSAYLMLLLKYGPLNSSKRFG
jgi:dolichol-phosphate mannosyltransferase